MNPQNITVTNFKLIDTDYTIKQNINKISQIHGAGIRRIKYYAKTKRKTRYFFIFTVPFSLTINITSLITCLHLQGSYVSLFKESANFLTENLKIEKNNF